MNLSPALQGKLKATRTGLNAIAAGKNIRARRWWWENPERKEYGLRAKKSGTHT